MTNIRCFVAFELPTGLRSRLVGVMTELKNSIPRGVSWSPVEEIHLTLKFLGSVPDSKIENLKKDLAAAAASNSLFSLFASGLGAFPTIRKPRVIWVGIEESINLHQIQKIVDSLTSGMGLPADERTFFPHLTLGRIARDVAPGHLVHISNILTSTRFERSGPFQIKHLTFFKSDLLPSGAIHTPLLKSSLGGSSS